MDLPIWKSTWFNCYALRSGDSVPEEMMICPKWKCCLFLQCEKHAVWTQGRCKGVELCSSVLCVQPFQGCVINDAGILRPMQCPLAQLHESISVYVTHPNAVVWFSLRAFPVKKQVLFTVYTSQIGSRCFPLSLIFAVVLSLCTCLYPYIMCVFMVLLFS